MIGFSLLAKGLLLFILFNGKHKLNLPINYSVRRLASQVFLLVVNLDYCLERKVRTNTLTTTKGLILQKM